MIVFLFVNVEGKAGNKIRQAGWEAWEAFKAARARGSRAWRAADSKYDIRGRWQRFDAPGRWRRVDARFDLGGKARAAGRRLARLRDALLTFLRRRGVTARAAALWEKTGIPYQWRSFQQEQELQARIRNMRERGM